VIESISGFDLGIGVNVDFSGGRHQGMNEVYFTTVRDGQFLPILDWRRWWN